MITEYYKHTDRDHELEINILTNSLALFLNNTPTSDLNGVLKKLNDDESMELYFSSNIPGYEKIKINLQADNNPQGPDKLVFYCRKLGNYFKACYESIELLELIINHGHTNAFYFEITNSDSDDLITVYYFIPERTITVYFSKE